MSPFASKKQARAAFGGYLGPEMKAKAREFAEKTDFRKLPEHVKGRSKSEALKRKLKEK